MRTESVRVSTYGFGMLNPLIAEDLARQHQQDLLADAARAQLARRAGDGGWPWWVLNWRLRAGRTLIRAGEWLAAGRLAAAWRDAAS